MEPANSPLIAAMEGSGKDGWHLYVARTLRCVLVGRKRLDDYEKDVTFGILATRRLSAQWLSWLRRYHSATPEEAIEFSRLVKLVNPELSGAAESVSNRYLPPFAMQSFFSFPWGCT
jgi:hypothetical protein